MMSVNKRRKGRGGRKRKVRTEGGVEVANRYAIKSGVKGKRNRCVGSEEGRGRWRNEDALRKGRERGKR